MSVLKWDLETRGSHRIMQSGKFRVLQTGTDAILEHPSLPVLLYPNVDMAKRVALYLHQGGMEP